MPNGKDTLPNRMTRIESVVLGTAEQDHKDGLRYKVDQVQGTVNSITQTADKIFRWLNRWGVALLVGLAGSGILNGTASKILRVVSEAIKAAGVAS